MADQRLKLLYLLKIFLHETDEEHGLTLSEIQKKLLEYDIPADRKTLYSDFDVLERFGYEVLKEKSGHTTWYRIPQRDFELSELKLLTDAVQAARFITAGKSASLIRKLENLVSVHDAKKLNRQVLMTGRVKSMNESIYYSVDAIHEAINEDRTIRFQYFNWTPDKKMVLRHEGGFYEISPFALVWDDEYYYMIGYDPEAVMIKHYRVDKMLKISMTEHARSGRDVFSGIDLQKYGNSLFRMNGGTEARVTLRCENDCAGIIIDQFGLDTFMHRVNDTQFEASMNVFVSSQFFAWLFGLGKKVRLTAPENIVREYRDYVKTIADIYTVDGKGADPS